MNRLQKYVEALSPDGEDTEVAEYAENAEVAENAVPVDGQISETEDLLLDPPPEPEQPPAKKLKNPGNSPVKKTAPKKAPFVWEDGMVHFLINAWKQLSVLYNTADPNYSNKDKKSSALNHIIAAMNEEGSFAKIPDKTEINDKMSNLRVYYNVQKRKVDASKGTGSGASDVYKSQWKFYDELDFLRSMVTPRATLSNLDDETTFREVQRVQKENRRKSDSPNPALDAMKESTYVLKTLQQKENIPPAGRDSITPIQPVQPPALQPKSLNEHFGETVAKLMDEIDDPMTRDRLKIEIQNLIFKAKYYPQTNSINTPQIHPRSFRFNQGSYSGAQHPTSSPSTAQQTPLREQGSYGLSLSI